MSVYKEEKTNTWRVIYRYTDWNGERKQSQKRGFPTKREAQTWEREQLNKKSGDPDMTFASFIELYKGNWIIGLLGAMVLAAAYWIAATIHDPLSALLWFFAAVGMVILATYMLFQTGSVLLCRILQKNKNYSPVFQKEAHVRHQTEGYRCLAEYHAQGLR